MQSDFSQKPEMCNRDGCEKPAQRAGWCWGCFMRIRRYDALERHKRVQTHCKRGHAFTDENTYLTKAGSRQCKACKAKHDAEYRADMLALTGRTKPPKPIVERERIIAEKPAPVAVPPTAAGIAFVARVQSARTAHIERENRREPHGTAATCFWFPLGDEIAVATWRRVRRGDDLSVAAG